MQKDRIETGQHFFKNLLCHCEYSQILIGKPDPKVMSNLKKGNQISTKVIELGPF